MVGSWITRNIRKGQLDPPIHYFSLGCDDPEFVYGDPRICTLKNALSIGEFEVNRADNWDFTIVRECFC
jgi:hypothetical protein